MINSIDRDGSGCGYDVELIRSVTNTVNLPVIAMGGAGKWQHMKQILDDSNISAVAAANIFQHKENSVYEAKKYLFEAGNNIRPPMLKTMQSVGGF